MKPPQPITDKFSQICNIRVLTPPEGRTKIISLKGSVWLPHDWCIYSRQEVEAYIAHCETQTGASRAEA